MQKIGAIARFTKILDMGGNFTPPPNPLTSMEKPNHNSVNQHFEDRKFVPLCVDASKTVSKCYV